MNKSEFIDEIQKIGINITSEKLEKLEIYMNFLIEYNKHTNLTTITNPKDIYLKHFYDSLMIVKGCDLTNVKNLIDIGTGAGFPGMVIKIFYPEIAVTLLDSNNKKINFLNELAKKIDLEVEIVNDRVENYTKNNLNKFDIVTSRAVANLRVLSEISLPLLKVNGLFIPLKGNIDDTFENSLDTIDIFGAKIINLITFDLYKNGGKRNIIVIKKLEETHASKLRTYDKILKKPLKKIFK